MVESLEKPRLLCLFGSAFSEFEIGFQISPQKKFLLVQRTIQIQPVIAFISFFFVFPPRTTRLCLGTRPYMPLLPLLAVWKKKLLSPRLSSQALWLLEY